jgi:hypothetical protein
LLLRLGGGWFALRGRRVEAVWVFGRCVVARLEGSSSLSLGIVSRARVPHSVFRCQIRARTLTRVKKSIKAMRKEDEKSCWLCLGACTLHKRATQPETSGQAVGAAYRAV